MEDDINPRPKLQPFDPEKLTPHSRANPNLFLSLHSITSLQVDFPEN